jgi:hypothetical protein
MMQMASGLVVVTAYLALIALFGYLIFTKDPGPDLEAEMLDNSVQQPLQINNSANSSMKLIGVIAVLILLGTSLVMWFDS